VRKRRDPVVKATIRVAGKKVRVRRVKGRLRATVDMLFQPKKTFTVTIRGTTRSGRKVSGKRVYHPCQVGRKGSVPEL
jgi:ABC-type phosphate transport system ATPase subunit